MSCPHIVIAIDGPAASGKSSVARALAKRVGFVYVNTGAMYRALTWLVIKEGIEPTDVAAILELLERAQITCGVKEGESVIHVDGVDPAEYLSAPEVNASVSAVASVKEVRRILVSLQRDYIKDYNLVMEGRDIGSAVFPETPYKFYIDASPEVRAQRRALQGIHDDLVKRDKIDSSRQNSPLVIAEDAYVIDSSKLTVDGVVGEIIGRLKLKGLTLG